MTDAKEETDGLVRPLDPQAFQMVMGIVDNSDMKGRDAENIIRLKRELARVANMITAPAAAT